TFSPNNDGWLAPGEGGYAYLGTNNLERGLAYNPFTDHLYLVSRANVGGDAANIRILDKNTGADLGGLNKGSGIVSGGTFVVNTVRVGEDGAIYVANLTTSQGAGLPFKVYRWANESATPTVAFNGTILSGARIGDSTDVIGSGSSTLMVAGYGSSPSVGGNNGYAVIDLTAGTGTHISFGTPPNPGDFRLGITFGSSSSHVLGAQTGGTATTVRNTSYSGSTGTLLNTISLSGTGQQAILDYAVIAGIPFLAAHSIGDSTVRIWDISDPNNPVLYARGNNTSGTLTSNVNGTGQMAWGDITYDSVTQTWSAKLWSLSSNQGIQAFVVTVPEPSSITLATLGGLALLALFGRRRISQ
ncbi:MAG: PEP-CTERM sorting domain-containing protein, partial [Verrucomicrobiales bacterium]|nr:PEP-CTERM sorting domain-containing protein [Verrucomicrobiales bacterium]